MKCGAIVENLGNPRQTASLVSRRISIWGGSCRVVSRDKTVGVATLSVKDDADGVGVWPTGVAFFQHPLSPPTCNAQQCAGGRERRVSAPQTCFSCTYVRMSMITRSANDTLSQRLHTFLMSDVISFGLPPPCCYVLCKIEQEAAAPARAKPQAREAGAPSIGPETPAPPRAGEKPDAPATTPAGIPEVCDGVSCVYSSSGGKNTCVVGC